MASRDKAERIEKVVARVVATAAALAAISAVSLTPQAFAVDDPQWRVLKNAGSKAEVFSDYKTAEDKYRKALQSAETSGASKLVTTELAVRLATALVTRGKFQEAEPYYQKSMAALPTFTQLGHRREDLLACLDALAETYYLKADGPDALFCLRHMRHILETAFPGTHPHLQKCLTEMGEQNLRLSRYPQAKSLLVLAAKSGPKRRGEKEVKWQLNAEAVLAAAYLATGDAAGALRVSENSMTLSRKSGVSPLPVICVQMSNCYLALGRMTEAQAMYKMNETALLSLLSSKSLPTKKRGSVLRNCLIPLIRLYFAHKQFDKAAPMCRKTIEQAEASYGKDNSILIEPLMMLSQIEAKSKHAREAAQLKARADAIRKLYLSRI